MIADGLNPLTMSHIDKNISNKPPGISKRTSTLYPKSAKIVPEIKIIYPIKPQTDIGRGTSFD